MTPEEIRAEAIERVAQVLFAARRRPSDPDWGDPRPGFAWLWKLRRDEAARLVDALGDLLPTGVDDYRRTDFDEQGYPVVFRSQRYVTDWRQVPDGS